MWSGSGRLIYVIWIVTVTSHRKTCSGSWVGRNLNFPFGDGRRGIYLCESGRRSRIANICEYVTVNMSNMHATYYLVSEHDVHNHVEYLNRLFAFTSVDIREGGCGVHMVTAEHFGSAQVVPQVFVGHVCRSTS